MSSQPSTQPVKVKRQTTLHAFLKAPDKQPPIVEALVLGAPPHSATSAHSSGQHPSVCRALRYHGTASPDSTDSAASFLQDSKTDSDEDDVPLSLLLARQSTAGIGALPPRASAGSEHGPHIAAPSVAVLHQTQLDFGQTITPTMECPTCGMVYSTTTTDAALHRKACKGIAAARADQTQRAFVEDLFAGCDRGVTEGDTARNQRKRRRDGQDPVRRRGSGRAHKAATLLQALQSSVATTSYIRLSMATPSPKSMASSNRFAVAVLDGNHAHVWGRQFPSVLEQLVQPPMSLGTTIAWIADRRRLASQDALAGEVYPEAPNNIRIVVVLDNEKGTPLAAVVGREANRSVEVSSSTEASSPERAQTRCDVLQVWCTRETSSTVASQATASRASYLFETVIASSAPTKTFWSRPSQSSSAASAPTVAVTSYGCHVEEAALLAALEMLGKNITYGCHVDWRHQMCFAADVAHHDSLSLLAAEAGVSTLLPAFDWREELDDVDPDAHPCVLHDNDSDDEGLEGRGDSSCSNSEAD